MTETDLSKARPVPSTSAARVAAYRARRREAGEPDTTRRNRKDERKAWVKRQRTKHKPFIGCDGEGCGTDVLGRQLYMLFRMGSRELFTGSPLSTWELLNFICSEPSGSILVGFAFGYDVTMILRDIGEKQQRRLFEAKVFGEGISPFVWYREFDIDYLPKQYLRVRRVRIERHEDGTEKRIPVKGSVRTIYETFGFFQKAFLKVLKEFGVGTPEQLQDIAAGKDARAAFVEIDQMVRDYCALEVVFLAELMEKLRDYCEEGGIFPRTWSGAGKLAAALHTKHATPHSAQVNETVPADVMALANMAYYGGRFEITRTGLIEREIFEYDIRSAYPSAMRELPCLIHGGWAATDDPRSLSEADLCLCGVSFKRNDRLLAGPGNLGALPIRSREGHLYWPLQGRGVYWSCEIDSAKRRGWNVKYKSGWIYRKSCDCQPFDWVEPLFDYRRSIGSTGPGYPIKLGINSLYGKLAQRKGNGAFNNMVWAGLITAITRARLNDAIALNPTGIVMVATDAVYSTRSLELHLGDWLGSWEQTVLENLFIVQPGLYWDATKAKRKSRGLSGKFFEEPGRTDKFERAWHDYAALSYIGAGADFPTVSVPVPAFIGLKLALARNKPDLAGTWTNDSRDISFDYRNKRGAHEWEGAAAVTRPKLGGPHCVSLPHREFLAAGGAEPWEAARAMLDDQPDFIDFGAPWKDD